MRTDLNKIIDKFELNNFFVTMKTTFIGRVLIAEYNYNKFKAIFTINEFYAPETFNNIIMISLSINNKNIYYNVVSDPIKIDTDINDAIETVQKEKTKYDNKNNK